MVQTLNERQDFNPTPPPGYTEASATSNEDDSDTGSDFSFTDVEGPPRSTASPPPETREATPMLHPPPPQIPACNFLDISKDYMHINGKWRIDTSLFIPPAMLFPLEEGEQRFNLSLTTQAGPIDAEVELVRGDEDERALLKFLTRSGPITVKLNAPNHQNALVNCTANAGPVRIFIPRSFRGPVSIKESFNMSNNFSQEVTANTIMFYQRNGETKAFIGELSGSGFGEEGEEWEGDEITSESQSGGVFIAYEDEAAIPYPGPGHRGHHAHHHDHGHGHGFGWWHPMPPTLPPLHGVPPPAPPPPHGVPPFPFGGFPFDHHYNHHHGEQQWPFGLFGMFGGGGGDNHHRGRGRGRGFHFGFGEGGPATEHELWFSRQHQHVAHDDDHHHHEGEEGGREAERQRRETERRRQETERRRRSTERRRRSTERRREETERRREETDRRREETERQRAEIEAQRGWSHRHPLWRFEHGGWGSRADGNSERRNSPNDGDAAME